MYFALKDTSEIGKALEAKFKTFEQFLTDSGKQILFNNLYRMFFQGKYHLGSMYVTGENGEFMNINVADFRNNILHIKSLILSQKITFTPAAENTDVDTLSQTLLGKSVMAHYARLLRADIMMDEWIDLAMLYADSYALVQWDETLGRPLVPAEDGTMVFEGDAKIGLFPQHMVAIDPINPDSQWHIFLIKMNKWELAVQFPDQAAEIEKQQMNEMYKIDGRTNMWQTKYSEDTIYVKKFFHKDCPLVPGGREVLFINDQLVLEDVPLKTSFYPVVKFQVANVEDSPFGYSSTFDSVQLATANNKVYSTFVTNVSKFGVDVVLSPKGADIDVTDVVDGAKFLEYDPSAGVPTTLSLLNTSEHVYKLAQLLEMKEDITMGVNMVTKGQAPEKIESGSGLALLQSMSVQFNSQIQKNFVVALEELFTKLLMLLQVKVTNKRLVDIVGEDMTQYEKEWSGDAIKGLSKVSVELGDPAKDTAVGRAEMADNLLQYGDITMQDYFLVRETGSAGVAINRKTSHAMLIARENELLMKGIAPILSKSDHHIDHMESHLCLLDQPQIREDKVKTLNILMHVAAHEDMYKMLLMTDPLFLQMTGQPLIPMALPPPPPPGDSAKANGKEPKPASQPNNPMTGQTFDPATGGLNGAQ